MLLFLSSSFVISEIAFFEKWWNEQTLSTQNIVRKLVFKGQLHFVGGGYTQNDEATTHYTAIIDNLALGFYFIKKHFGKCTHWQKVRLWLWPSARHFKEVTVTLSQVTVTLK